MTLRTVLRSSPVRRAIADMPAPCRCKSRIVTISPSWTTKLSPRRREQLDHQTPTDPIPPRQPSSSQLSKLGNFQSALLGSFHPAATDRDATGLRGQGCSTLLCAVGVSRN